MFFDFSWDSFCLEFVVSLYLHGTRTCMFIGDSKLLVSVNVTVRSPHLSLCDIVHKVGAINHQINK